MNKNSMKIYDWLRNIICPLDKVLEFVPKNGKILDIGSGYGTFSILMAKLEGRRVLGIELDSHKVEYANNRTKDHKNLYFICADINDIDIYEKFDTIVCIDVLHHINLKYYENIFEKFYKFLADDGFLIIKELDTRPYYKYLWSYVHDIILNGVPHYLSNEDISRLLKINRFDIIVNKNVNNIFYEHYILVCRKMI